jgi:lactate permease
MEPIVQELWKQVYMPFGDSYLLPALVAAIPLVILFVMLAVLRKPGHKAAFVATSAAVLLAIFAWGMPVKLALSATAFGAAYGLFPIVWIVITAIWIYNMTVESGEFEIIKNSLASITEDRRLQAIFIAFAFGSFIEGTAGFGTPVAITAAMLAGLGFKPLYAAGICLIANTAPVAFGAIGIPIIVGSQVSGVDSMALSQMVGRTLPFVSVLIPLYMVVLMSGWKKGLEVWPAALVSGGSFAVAQFLTANFVGPLLPDIIASITSIVCLVVFLRFWQPKESWHFDGEPKSTGRAKLMYTGGQVFRAWTPFIILSIFVAAWGVKPIKMLLDQYSLVGIPLEGLNNMVIRGDKPMAAVYMFNILSAAGTAILFAGLFSIPVMKASLRTAGLVALDRKSVV